MSKYNQLTQALLKNPAPNATMGFREIEQLIGAPLPPSARRHRAWWSNNPSNNVATHAWLEAGRRTQAVDLSAETVHFVRAKPASPHQAADRNAFSSTLKSLDATSNSDAIVVALSRLSLKAQSFLAGSQDAARILEDVAVAAIEQEVATRLRRETLSRFAALRLGAQGGTDSVDLVREDRDGRHGA